MDHTKSIYLLMEDKAYASGTKQDPHSILQLARFLRIAKTKNYMFCSPDRAVELRLNIPYLYQAVLFWRVKTPESKFWGGLQGAQVSLLEKKGCFSL